MKSLLENESIRLRACEPGDAVLVYRAENDTDEWETSVCNEPVSLYSVQRFIDECTGDFFMDCRLKMVIERKADGMPLGFVDLFGYDHLTAKAEIGMLVLRPFRGMGYARQAAALAVDYAFSRLKLNQIYAYFTTDNVKAIGLFEALGFVRAGTLRQWFFSHTSGYKDAVVMQLLGGR